MTATTRATTRSRDGDGTTTLHRWLMVAIVALGLLLTIGPPIVGQGIFAGTDLLERIDPWASTEPDVGAVDNALRGDETDVGLPARRQINERLRAGEFPTWLSEVNGGGPLATVPNASALAPLDAPWLVLPFTYAPAAAKLLEVLVAILGTMALLRGHGVRRDVSLLAGFLVAYGGYVIVWTSWPVASLTAMFPAMLWSVDHARRRGTVAAHAPLTILVAAGWLEGHPALFIVELLLLGVWALWSQLGTAAVRDLARRLAGLAAAVVVGTALAAFQLVPFLSQLSRYDTDSRLQTAADHLPFDHLITAIFPFALGDLDNWRGVENFAEGHTWLGVVPIVLLGLWAWRGAGEGRSRLSSFLATVAGVGVVLVWLGGPLLAAAQRTPLFSINAVGRIRSLPMLAVVLLGALALDRFLQSSKTGGRDEPDDPGRWRPIRVGVLALLAIAVPVVALPEAVDGARRAGQGHLLQADIAIAAVAAAVVIGVLWLHRRPIAGHRLTAALVVPALLAVAVVETDRLTNDVWPNIEPEAFYPSTPAHDFLREAAGDDRTASAERALYPGTTTWYGIRTVAGHAFPPSAWKQALLAIDPGAYGGSQTQPLLAPTPEVARSPLLDRLAAVWWVTDLDHPPIGDPAMITFSQTETGFSADLPPGRPFRSVVLPSTAGVVDSATTVTTTVLDGADQVASSATRRLLPSRLERPVVLSVPQAAGERLVVRWEGSPVPASALGDFDAVFANEGDSLDLAWAEGVLAYRRLDALPRFRWASRSITLDDDEERLAALAEGAIAADTVVLHDPPTSRGGIRTADVDVIEPDGSTLRVAVDAGDAGWLVVADSLQDDWVVTVDGKAAELLAADHVGVAVALEAGQHDVVFSHRPAAFRTGARLTATALLVGVIALVVSCRRREGTRTRR